MLAACGQRGKGAGAGCPPFLAKRGSCGFSSRLRAMRPPQLGNRSKQLVVVGATSDELDSETESKGGRGITHSFVLTAAPRWRLVRAHALTAHA